MPAEGVGKKKKHIKGRFKGGGNCCARRHRGLYLMAWSGEGLHRSKRGRSRYVAALLEFTKDMRTYEHTQSQKQRPFAQQHYQLYKRAS